MAYMLLQRWHAPVPLELHPAGKVSIAGSELQGWWAHEGAENNLSVCFRFNEDSEAQTLLFQEIPVWEKVNGDRRYKCFLCLKDDSPDR